MLQDSGVVTLYLCIYLVQENVDILIKASTEDLGFINGKPVVTYIVYKSLLHWKVFEAERTSVFDRLIQVFSTATQVRCYIQDIHMFLQNAEPMFIYLITTGGYQDPLDLEF